MSFATIEYTVTFRIDKGSPQQELKRYTRNAAEIFADGIISMGGVAIVTEGIAETLPENEEINSRKEDRSLKWE